MSKISICKTCNKEIIVSPGAKGIYCSRQCHILDQSQISKRTAAVRRAKLEQQYKDNVKTCGNCKVQLTFEQRKQTFCSQSCSTSFLNKSRIHSIESREKRRLKAKSTPKGWAKSKIGGAKQKGKFKVPRESRICITCSKTFEIIVTGPKKTCKECSQIGGVRPGSGRSKSGRYKGIYCGSTYELAFLIWHLDNNKNIRRCIKHFPYIWNNKTYRYYPDFEVDDQIYEIKGRKTEIDDIKVAAASAIIIDSIMIQQYIVYVAQKYNVHKFQLWKLYDVQVEKVCELCNNVFIPTKKDSKFCSRSCAMKVNRLFSRKLAPK